MFSKLYSLFMLIADNTDPLWAYLIGWTNLFPAELLKQLFKLFVKLSSVSLVICSSRVCRASLFLTNITR